MPNSLELNVSPAQLHTFANHPFHVRKDMEMNELVDSIRESGVIVPLIVRSRPEGGYEIISGHRRCEACRELGIEKVPVRVQELTDDEATILMVNSNIQREHVLPSEKAFAYKMKMDAMKHQGRATSGQVVPKLDDRRTGSQIGSSSGESYKTVQRYIRLTHLISPILQMVDESRMAFNPAVEISYMTPEHQRWLQAEIELCEATPSLVQSRRLKEMSQSGTLTEHYLHTLLTEQKPNQRQKFFLNQSDVQRFFPPGYTPEQMQNTIFSLLKTWGHAHEHVSTFTDFAKLLQSEGVKIRVKKLTEQLLYKAADLDGAWIPADALGDGFTLAGLESAIKNKSETLDTNRSTPIAELYHELTTNYPQSCDTSVRLTARQICSAGKRGVLLQIHDSSGNPAKLMIDNSHIHTTPDGSVSADIGAAFSYDITYDDGTHGTIRGTDLIRQIDEENLTQPLIVSLTADQIMAMSLRGVTVHLPQYHIERLFIPERYVQRNVEQGSCAISLYPGWQYSYVPIGSENTRKSISGAELAQSLGGVVQVGTSESSLARRVANVERRAGIANAQELGKLLGSMADNGLHSAADFDKQISTYQREEMKFRNKIAELRSKSKIYASTAHNLQACRTYKSVWLEYASKPLAQKDTFYKQNEAALQAYSRAASQLDGMGISQLVEPERIQRLVSETENRITELVAELEKVQNADNGMQEDKERVKQIQSNEINGTYSAFSRA